MSDDRWHEKIRCHRCKQVAVTMNWHGGKILVDPIEDHTCPACFTKLTHQWLGPVVHSEYKYQYSGGWCPTHGSVEVDWEWS